MLDRFVLNSIIPAAKSEIEIEHATIEGLPFQVCVKEIRRMFDEYKNCTNNNEVWRDIFHTRYLTSIQHISCSIDN